MSVNANSAAFHWPASRSQSNMKTLIDFSTVYSPFGPGNRDKGFPNCCWEMMWLFVFVSKQADSDWDKSRCARQRATLRAHQDQEDEEHCAVAAGLSGLRFSRLSGRGSSNVSRPATPPVKCPGPQSERTETRVSHLVNDLSSKPLIVWSHGWLQLWRFFLTHLPQMLM